MAEGFSSPLGSAGYHAKIGINSNSTPNDIKRAETIRMQANKVCPDKTLTPEISEIKDKARAKELEKIKSVLLDENTDYYSRLGVSRNATPGVIKKAFRQQAMIIHPDKTNSSETEEHMKELNKMKAILLDGTKRKEYDEELLSKTVFTVPLFMRENRGRSLLPPASRYSEKYIYCLSESSRQFSGQIKPAAWTDFDQKLTKIQCNPPNSNLFGSGNVSDFSVTFRKKRSTSISVTDSINANRFSTVDSDYCDTENLELILQRMRDGRVETMLKDTANGVVPLWDTSKVSGRDLQKLLSLFLEDALESANDYELRQQLSKFIPITTIQPLPVSKFKDKRCASCSRKPNVFSGKFITCYWCSRPFCKHCPVKNCQFTRISTTSQDFCHECVESLTRADKDDWVEATMKFLSNTDDNSIIASFGCAIVAMALGANPIDLLKQMARKSQRMGLLDVALNIVDLAVRRCLSEGNPSQELKIHVLASSIMADLARAPYKTWEEKWCLALASKDAHVHSRSLICQSNEIEDMGNDSTEEMDALLKQLLNEQKKKHEQRTSEHLCKLNALWEDRDVLGILNYIQEITANNTVTVVEDDQALTVLQKFIRPKELYLSQLRPDDCSALLFLITLLKLKEQDPVSAFESFSKMAWNSLHSNLPLESIMALYLHMLSESSTTIMSSYAAVKSIVQSGSSVLFLSPPQNIPGDKWSKLLLFPSEKELTPPFAPNWPQLSICDHNTRCHVKCEEAVLKLYNKKKWTRKRVAWAYVDQIPGCEHPAEIVVCSLHAAMWLVADLHENLSRADCFALKCVIMQLLTFAFAVSLKCLNPGMEVYTIRLAIGIIRKIAQSKDSNHVMTEDDHHFLELLLDRLMKVIRSFPLWEIPSVSVSEAVMLNILTKNLYCNFLLGLQEVKKESGPLTSLELKYQLYECDLRGMLPLENSSDSRARAMEGLLSSQKWKWNDVEQLMRSPLIHRDRDGWIIQSHQFEARQEFFELTGFRIDTDPNCPSIQLLVVKADPHRGKYGLFSQIDVNDMLQLDKSDLPLFFSLDPPEDNFDKQYHPFQRWRCTNKMKGTEILKTMFVADYLMKSFTVGSDVSACPPFQQRPCKEGLTKNIPPELQEAIRSIHERGGTYSHSSHRFWIESGEMKFDCKQIGSVIEFNFGEMEMIVKSHSMLQRSDGKLDDTDEDDDPNSPHKMFASDMTENYKGLSHYFPIFARLRQLSKLQTLFVMLESVLQSMKESSHGKNVEIPQELVKSIQEDARKQHRANVSDALDKTKETVGVWPRAQNRSIVQSKVDEVKQDIYGRIQQEEARLHRIYGYNINIDNSDALRTLNDVELQVISALRESDEHTHSQVVLALQEGFKLPARNRSLLSDYVRDWLSLNQGIMARFTQTPKETLMNYICSHLSVPTHSEIKEVVVQRKKQEYMAVSGLIRPYKAQKCHPTSSCTWVPAAVYKELHSVSYGGVAFNIISTPVKRGESLPVYRNQTAVLLSGAKPYSTSRHNTNYSTPKGNARPRDSSEQGSNQGSSGSKSSSGNHDKSSSSNSACFPREAAAAATAADNSNDNKYKKVIKGATKTSKPERPQTATITQKTSLKVRDAAAKFSQYQCNQTTPTNLVAPKASSKSKGPKKQSASGSRGPSGANGGKSGGPQGPSPPGEPPSPLQISWTAIKDSLRLPDTPQQAKSPGLYVLRNKATGHVYAGRSCDVSRRISEHERSILKGEKTVGKEFKGHSPGDLEKKFVSVPRNMKIDDMRYYEQKLMDVLKEKGFEVFNRIRAMKKETYERYDIVGTG